MDFFSYSKASFSSPAYRCNAAIVLEVCIYPYLYTGTVGGRTENPTPKNSNPSHDLCYKDNPCPSLLPTCLPTSRQRQVMRNRSISSDRSWLIPATFEETIGLKRRVSFPLARQKSKITWLRNGGPSKAMAYLGRISPRWWFPFS